MAERLGQRGCSAAVLPDIPGDCKNRNGGNRMERLTQWLGAGSAERR